MDDFFKIKNVFKTNYYVSKNSITAFNHEVINTDNKLRHSVEIFSNAIDGKTMFLDDSEIVNFYKFMDIEYE